MVTVRKKIFTTLRDAFTRKQYDLEIKKRCVVTVPSADMRDDTYYEDRQYIE